MIRLDPEAVQQAAADVNLAGGAFDPDQVYIQLICQTTDGGHDPNGTPDDKVRPEHRALHGTVWRLDDPQAPIPPLDWGCRCAIRYVGKPGTTASAVLPEAPAPPESSPERSATAYLDSNVPEWEQVAQAMAKAPAGGELAAGAALARSLGIRDFRAIVRLIAQAKPKAAPTVEG